MNLEKIFYAPFGNNIIIGKHIKDQLKFLSKVVPDDFKGKEIYDLGCGDGKITILLQDILKPSRISGCDVSSGLVRRAEKKGIAGRVCDLEDDMPKGELAIVWGVIHHLKNQMKALKKIKENFQFLFLREPLVEEGKKSIFELGEPFEKERIEKMCGEIFGEDKNCEYYKEYEYKEAYFLFWQRPRNI